MCVIVKDWRGRDYYWNEDIAEWVEDKREATIYECAEDDKPSRARKLARQLGAQLEPFDSQGAW